MTTRATLKNIERAKKAMENINKEWQDKTPTTTTTEKTETTETKQIKKNLKQIEK